MEITAIIALLGFLLGPAGPFFPSCIEIHLNIRLFRFQKQFVIINQAKGKGKRKTIL